jgi:hypothetical protein
MISKSRLRAKLGAVAFVAATGVAYPAFAAHYGPGYTAPSHRGNYYNYVAPRSAGPAADSPAYNCPPMCWRLQHHHK